MSDRIKNALKIKGYMEPGELELLAHFATKYSLAIEIGTYYGRSARAIADNLKGKLYCIDPYPGAVFSQGNTTIYSGNFVFRQAQRNLKDHIDTGKVVFHRGTINDFPYEITPDFIFIDGDHLKQSVTKDILWARSVLCVGGTIAGHDYGAPGWPDVKTVVDEMVRDGLLNPIQIDGTIWYSNYIRR